MLIVACLHFPILLLAYSLHACMLIVACLHAHCCMLACSLHACVPILTLRACRVSVCMCKCQCRSVRVCSANVVEVSVCKRKCRSVSVQGIFRKNPSQCFREKVIFLGTSLGSKNHSKNRSRHRGPPQFKNMCGHTCLQGMANNCSRRCKTMETQRYAKPLSRTRGNNRNLHYFSPGGKILPTKRPPFWGPKTDPKRGPSRPDTSKSN